MPSELKRKTLFVITVHSDKYRNNLFFDEVRRGINIEANIVGINVEFLFGFNHNTKIFSEVAGIIFAPDGSAKCKKFIDEIKNQYKIPVVQIDNQVFDKKLSPRYDAFIGIDNLHGGKATASYLKTYLKENSKILVIGGSKNFPFLSYNQRLDGFKKELHNKYFIENIIYGNFDHQKVYGEMHKYIANNKKIPDAIFAFNDDSAIVAGKVLREKNIRKDIIIAGFDGSAAGRVALSKNQIICSYDQDPENLGRKSFRIFYGILKKEKIERVNLIQSTLLTRKNIGITFYSGVGNFLDRALTPFSFRKRMYEICSGSVKKPLSEYRNELTCPIIIDDNKKIIKFIRQIDADKFIIISDDNDFLKKERSKLKGFISSHGISVEEVGFLPEEKNKNEKTLFHLIESILDKKISKKTCLILIGGGITGNVGGLAASLLYRGIKFVHIPTTLMHMVDSSTGGKQAIDSRFGKNTIGSFYEPEFILINAKYAKSLPKSELINGVSECIKHALCQDEEFYKFIRRSSNKILGVDGRSMSHLIEKTIKLKLVILNNDSYELNEGMALVYGHTMGNAIESASNFRLNHGQAISVGMVAAARLACEVGVAKKELVDQHISIFKKYGLPTKIPKNIKQNDIINFLRFDKKYVEKPLSFVLLEKIGKVYMKSGIVPQEVSIDVIKKVIKKMY